MAGGEHARLAAWALGIDALDAEQRRFTRLFASNAVPDAGEIIRGVDRVVCLCCSRALESTWDANARCLFPRARVEFVRERLDRVAALAWARREGSSVPPDPGADERRWHGGEGVVLHVGAGDESKRWPLDRWTELATRLRGAGHAAALLAGHVERERVGEGALRAAGVVLVESASDLARRLHASRLVVGADSGPAHLGAALGVPTVALFGPTDPARWAPIGPRASVLAPESPRAMAWLSVDAAADAVRGHLARDAT